jgi:4-alpha-glucanotransferase
MKRRAGILMHPTSFTDAFGTGDLGPEAYRFVDWLASAKQSLWQILPLNPTLEGDSPYYSYSALGTNPLLVSPDSLVEDGLLEKSELDRAKEECAAVLSSEPLKNLRNIGLRELKMALFETAAARVKGDESTGEKSPRGDRFAAIREAFDAFKKDNASWLDDFALFGSMKEDNCQRAWWEWPPGVARREPRALKEAASRLAGRIEFFKFVQFLFFEQWKRLREYARSKGIEIIGDVPIFVAQDSVDVWVGRGYFFLDENMMPTVVSGVPPDYFSPDGQLWGSPLYRWSELEKDNFSWWKERLRILLKLVDIVRLDHFRGFEAYWEIPAGERTAVNGKWVKGPGLKFFEEIKREFGWLPIIAEDLGVITPEVKALKDALELPGMKIVQFAFDGDPRNCYLQHNHIVNCLVYTGTHDNDTLLGWLRSIDETVLRRIVEYTGQFLTDAAPRLEDVHDHLIRLAYMSVARNTIVPTQDVLMLGSEARMNTPGTLENNWAWKMPLGALTEAHAAKMARLVEIYGRWPY